MKRLILNPITLAAFLMMFLVSGSGLFVSAPSLVENAEASGDKDKDKDDDEDSYSYDLANDESVTTTHDCSSLTNLQITYHEDFVATANASGPNIKVTGSDSTTCTVVIEKISGGTNCGYNIDTSDDSKMVITTNAQNDATDCEVVIKATVPRTTDVEG